ncbi:discoidin domain-containing protein [Candidatus Soleaferrea massiliensis]|uniref:discoidin domain-containing protein n=1 Tax=Candidatus Soleaferrea massiliensis TaxID=1470354 RepID=UPI00069477F6|nr:discoidin domain-containing protein [Candidatus Soleaferrea massiliensis]
MKRRRLNRVISVLLSAAIMLGGAAFVPKGQIAAAQDSESRTILNFNNNWGYYMGDLDGAEAVDFDDSEFANVTVPHTMRLEKKHAGNANSVYQGIGWYRRYFVVDASYEGKQINIDFEGVMTDSDIYLNGEKLYTRNGGYIGFSVDITDRVKFGETNVLAVRVSSLDNRDTPPGKPLSGLDFHYYGGIYRDVELRITDNLHITDALQADETASGGVFVTYPEVGKEQAVVNVKTHVANENEAAAEAVVRTSLVDAEGNTVAAAEDASRSIEAGGAHQFEQQLTVLNPKLWHPDTPNLYTVVSEVYNGANKVDEAETRMGIRRIEMKPDGCYLNGEKIYIRGANRHQSYAYVGDAASDSMQVRDAIQMKENGFNGVRATHYPQSPAFLDACDEIGLLVVECQPGWQNFTNTDTFYNLTLRDTREMIRRDRNHASVLMWETSLNETGYSAQWAEDATRIAHEEFPGDQMFTAADYGLKGEYYDVNYKIVDGGVDHNPNKTIFTREWGDWAGMDQVMRKDGEAAMLKQVNTHERFLNGDGYPDWGGLDACDRMAGYFMWSWNDYARGSQKNTLPSGNVEVDRSEKYLTYWLMSMQPARSPAYGPMVYIASDYSASSSRTINVYSNCDSVRLYQNGSLVDELTREELASTAPNIVKKGGSPIFKFELPSFVAGELTAEAILDGEVAATHAVKTPGTAKSVSIEVGDRGIAPVADGSDLIPVYLKVVDENGTVIPDYKGNIRIAVLGEGELVGKDMPRVGVEDQTPEAGVGYAFIRTTGNAGTIRIVATAEGVGSASKEIETVPYTGIFVEDGEHPAWTGGVEKFEKPELNYKNLAQGKDATASSTQEDRGNYPANAVDNDEGTKWCASGGELPQWLKIDLGKVEEIAGFNMIWENGGLVYKYNIEVSENGTDWEKVVDMDENDKVNGNETKLVNTRGRYIRLNISYAGGLWACLWEFKVYAPLGDEEEQLPGKLLDNAMIESAFASCESEPDRGPDKLFDGETLIGTGWLAATTEFPQSVTVAFKEAQNLTGSRIYWEKDSSWYTYDLEVSTNGKAWVKALDNMLVGGQALKPEAFSKVYEDVNYVRVTIRDVLSSSGQPRIGMSELMFYTFVPPEEPQPEFVYLSDLDWVSAHSDYASVKKDEPAYNAGSGMSLNSENGVLTFEKGLGADTNSEIVYDIAGKGYTRLQTYIGINRGASKNGGEAVYKFYIDGKEVYTSPVLMRDDNCAFVDLEIPADAATLRLTAQWSGNTENPEARYNTHVLWADAKLFTAEKKPVPGDFDKDGKLGIADLLLYKEKILMGYNLTPETMEIIDVNKDGRINIFDMLLVKLDILNGTYA